MESIKQKLQKYAKYWNLSDKQRKNLVDNAEQEKTKAPNPQDEHLFPIINFVEYLVAD